MKRDRDNNLGEKEVKEKPKGLPNRLGILTYCQEVEFALSYSHTY